MENSQQKNKARRLQILSVLALCVPLTIIALVLAYFVPVVGASIFAIFLGIALAFIFIQTKNSFFANTSSAISSFSKRMLAWGIALIGFDIDLNSVLMAGAQSLFVMIFTIIAAFASSYLLASILHYKNKTAVLISIGTSICGGSAIAATAPIIKAKDEEFSKAISIIFLFNIIAVFLFPVLGHLLGMSDSAFALWAGTAINDTSSVVAATESWSSRVGNNFALTLGTSVKLTRTLLIVPIALILFVYVVTQEKKKNKAEQNSTKFNFFKIFPWFVIFFLLSATFHTFFNQGAFKVLNTDLSMIGKIFITLAMTGIGLKTDFAKLVKSGWKPLTIGIGTWFAVALVALLVQYVLGIT